MGFCRNLLVKALRRFFSLNTTRLAAQATGFSLSRYVPIQQGQISNTTREPVLIFLSVGEGLRDFVTNAVATLRSVESDLLVNIWTDAPEELDHLSSPLTKVLSLESTFEVGDYASFGSANFNRITSLKWELITRALENGHELVVFSDVDVAFRMPFLSYLENRAQTFPVGIQSENLGSWPPEFCTGFMYFGPGGVDITKTLSAYSAHNRWAVNDQVMLRNWLPSNPNYFNIVTELNGVLFPNGMAFCLLEDSNDSGLPPRAEPMIFHANWVAGLDAKKKLLKNAGLWLLD